MYVQVNTSLNVRNSANGTRIGGLTNKTAVTVVEESNGWSHITTPIDGWVSSQFLVSAQAPSIPNTVGQTKRFKSATTIYGNSNLTGAQYQYKANTSVKIMHNVSASVDKVYVIQTGRVGYVRNNVY